MVRFLAAQSRFGAILLLAATAIPLAHAQDGVRLRVGLWNMAWLSGREPSAKTTGPQSDAATSADIALARAHIDRWEADIIAILGVDRADLIALLFDPRSYNVHLTSNTAARRSGFAVRSRFRFDRHADVPGVSPVPDQNGFVRPGADITLYLGERKIRLLTVDLASGCDGDGLYGSGKACADHRRQAVAIAGWTATRIHTFTPFILFGQFERALNDHYDVWRIINMGGSARLVRSNAGNMAPCWVSGQRRNTAQLVFGGDARKWLAQRDLNVIASQKPHTLVAGPCPRPIDSSER